MTGIVTSVATPTIERIREVFNFDVDKFPLFGPENIPTPHYGLFRSDTGECIGNTVKKNYVPHTTDDVMAIAEVVQIVFGDCTPRTEFKNGHYIYLGPTKSERRIIASLKDARYPDGIFPSLNLRAGFDGKAFFLTIGYFRDLCANLAFLRLLRGISTKIRHTSGLRSKMNELISQISNIREGWETLGEYVDRMAATPVSLDSFLVSVLGEAPEKGPKLTRYEKRVSDIFQRVNKEHAAMGIPLPSLANNWQVSTWEAFNGVQGYVQHTMTRKGGATEMQRIVASDQDSSGLIAKAEAEARQLMLV